MPDTLTEENAVARCLAVLDGVFIDAATWEREQQAVYQARARRVIDTIDNVRGGNHSGGLPPRRTPLETYTERKPEVERTVSTHFTKAQADTACSKALIDAPKQGQSSGHARVKYIVKPTGKKLKRWQVVSV